MEQNIKKIGVVNLLVMFVVGVAGFGLARYANALSGQVGSIFLGLGFLVLAVSYFQMRLEETERLERLEFDELTRAKASASLFSASDAEVFPAGRAREQFERFFIPGFTVVLLLVQVGGAYLCWWWLKSPAVTALEHKPAVPMSLFALFALTLFLLGKYSAGIARLDGNRLLRPGASYLLLGAYISFLVAASLAAVQAGFSRFDLYAARILGVLLALTAVENLINLILEMYRPRVKGSAPRLLYDSRLIGLLSHPEGIFTTAAHALDYQFGFKVSETWVYRYFEKAFAWLLLLQLAALELSTCFVFISPAEQGLLERWGRYVDERGVLNPGLHGKMPFPIDRVYRAQTDQIQEFTIGSAHDEKGEHGNDNPKPRTILWTVPHEKEPFNLLVASRQPQSTSSTNAPKSQQNAPVDLLTVDIPVQYQISDLKAWMYNYTGASNLLENLATREIVHYLVSVDMMRLLSVEREKAALELRKRIQERADELKLGVRVLLVGLQDIHPPFGKGRTEVARKYEEVMGARQQVEARMREAEAYAATNRAFSAAEAGKRIQQAETYKVRTMASAAARAGQFTNQMLAFHASPRVFMERNYLQAFARGSTNARKYVLTMTNNPQDVIQINLEDKYDPLFDERIRAATKK